MELKSENYYSVDANMDYMSVSQFKLFMDCEAAALAESVGVYHPAPSQAMLVGSYVDAHFSGESALFAAQHPEMYRKDGQLKAEYVHAQEIIEKMEDDDLYCRLMAGEKQVIRTGEIAGVPFKIKIDSLLTGDQCYEITQEYPKTRAALGFLDGAIVDQKVMRDTGDVWSEDERRRVPFAQAYGYDIQGAVYQAIEGHGLPFILAVGTKESEPDLAALYIPQEDLDAALAIVEDNAPRFQAIKKGEIPPRRCERCDYCKATRQLDAIVSYKAVSAAW